MPTFSSRLKRFLARTLYDVLVSLSVPFFFTLIFLRGRQNSAYRNRLSQRLARGFANYPSDVIWFHAVSDGEFYAARQLIDEFIEAYPNAPMLITTTTPTGKARVENEFADLMGNRVWHAYLPFDQASFTRRFLKTLRPRIAIFVETEIWPNFLESLDAQQIPSALINARLSEKSYLGYERFGVFASDTIRRFSMIITQDNASAERFKQLLTPSDREKVKLKTSGNLKLDLTTPDDLSVQTARIRDKLGNTPFWIAASTHVGEDEIMLATHQQLTGLNLAIAPRHPDRSNDIVALCTKVNLRPVLFSNMQAGEEFDVVILDSIGQLLYFYAESSLAVIAGSFVEHGGHNPLEACLFKKPIISGPHYFNFQTMIDALVSANGMILSSETHLTEDIKALIAHPEQIANNGYEYLHANRGATAQTFTWLSDFLTHHGQ